MLQGVKGRGDVWLLLLGAMAKKLWVGNTPPRLPERGRLGGVELGCFFGNYVVS